MKKITAVFLVPDGEEEDAQYDIDSCIATMDALTYRLYEDMPMVEHETDADFPDAAEFFAACNDRAST